MAEHTDQVQDTANKIYSSFVFFFFVPMLFLPESSGSITTYFYQAKQVHSTWWISYLNIKWIMIVIPKIFSYSHIH